MKILALESSTACGSVAVLVSGQVLSFEKSMLQRSHSEFMNPAVERCLSLAKIKINEIDIFACGLGPGSFTGLRVSGNIAKTFAMTFKKPMVVADSLTLLQKEAVSTGAHYKKIICLLNAHKNMCYISIFENNQQTLHPTAMTLTEINKLQLGSDKPALGLGEGFLAYAEVLDPTFLKQVERIPEVSDYPLASTLGKLADNMAKSNQTIDWKSYKPLYIRASEAEENLKLKS